MNLRVKIKDNEQIIPCKHGDNLLDVLRTNNIFVRATCGGHGVCRNCKVKYQNQEILSCQTEITRNMEIEINHTSLININLQQNNKVNNEEPIHHWGIAIDLGTTTISFYLINLETNKEAEAISVLNLQGSYGADVISRIDSCLRGKLIELHNIIINQLNEIIIYFKDKYEITEIEKVVVSGNTTMLHILLNINPEALGVFPFTCVFLEKKIVEGEALNLNTKKIILLPSISSFLGSDMVSGIFATNLLNIVDNTLLIDLGTNGEIILKTKEYFLGCSTAVGPAFEGGNIECGIGGVNGAICSVTFDGKGLSFNTINDDQPIGICGSGLIDIIAILLREQIINCSGAFQKSNSTLSERIHDNRFYFNDQIYISQKDIRQFQLAKSAIISGIMTLIDEANISINNISKVLIAGGFGLFLNLDNVLRIGLFPISFADKISIVGNASGLGAKLVLINEENLKTCEYIASLVQTIDLSTNLKFTNTFIENIGFKEEL